MYKLCGKCGYHTDKCKNPNNANYNTFRNDFDVCSTKKIPFEEREAKAKERELRYFIKHPGEE